MGQNQKYFILFAIISMRYCLKKLAKCYPRFFSFSKHWQSHTKQTKLWYPRFSKKKIKVLLCNKLMILLLKNPIKNGKKGQTIVFLSLICYHVINIDDKWHALCCCFIIIVISFNKFSWNFSTIHASMQKA